MLRRQRIFGIGIAALLGLGILAAPSQASAQWYRRSRTHSEDAARNNAIALGAAGLILMNSHQNTLGTIALAGAAVEAGVMQHDIDQRHSRERYGYGYNDRYGYNGGYGYNDPYGYNGGYRRGDGDRDDRNDNDGYYNNGNGRGYGYGRANRDRDDRDRDRDRYNRRGGDSWYRSVIRNGNNHRRDRDQDGD